MATAFWFDSIRDGDFVDLDEASRLLEKMKVKLAKMVKEMVKIFRHYQASKALNRLGAKIDLTKDIAAMREKETEIDALQAMIETLEEEFSAHDDKLLTTCDPDDTWR